MNYYSIITNVLLMSFRCSKDVVMIMVLHIPICNWLISLLQTSNLFYFLLYTTPWKYCVLNIIIIEDVMYIRLLSVLKFNVLASNKYMNNGFIYKD